MTSPGFRWDVSALTPLLVVEPVNADEVRTIALFQVRGDAPIRSPEGEEACMHARIGAGAPRMLDALVTLLRWRLEVRYGSPSADADLLREDRAEPIWAEAAEAVREALEGGARHER